MDIKALKGFTAIANCRSFTQAAKQLSITQPTLSIQLKRLEDKLGFHLFHRSKKAAVELTSEGRKFLLEAHHVLQAYDRAVTYGREILASKSGQLTLGAESFSLHRPERNELVFEYLRSYPEIKFRVINDQPCELFSQLEEGTIDVMLCTRPDCRENLEMLKICEYDLGMFLPIETWSGEGTTIDLRSLSGSKVLNVNSRYHLPWTSRLCQFFSQFGIEIISPPEEGYEAVVRFSQMLRLPMLTLDLPPRFNETPADMVHCTFDGVALPIEWYLIKKKMTRSRALDKLWAMGTKIADNSEADLVLAR
ncbi:LysR family transcriptional regulator [Sphingomonas paeninsulae]|uniref:LysR family transcriptional regulator n=1 Tax=Sphingomonas paeninsulae TaxID=2319844 RepID=UPI0013CE7C68|nr:LysR family transcriptional regulator [Sphingomonas paeninsulae]